MSIPLARLAATVTLRRNSAEILRVNRPAEPIQDNGPLSGPEIFVTGPAFSELGTGNVRLPTAQYLLLPFHSNRLNREPSRPVNFFKPA
jgi:hypothetical protein